MFTRHLVFSIYIFVALIELIVVDKVHPIFFQKLYNSNLRIRDLSSLEDKEVLKELGACKILVIRSRFQVNADFLNHTPELRLIVRAGSGLDNIDEELCKRKGISCLNTPEGNRDAVAEHTLSLILALHTKIVLANSQIKEGIWDREGNRGQEINGKTLGIVGYGNCGSVLAKKVSGLGMQVVAYDKYLTKFSNKYAKKVSLQELQEFSDIVSVHIPFNHQNKYFINKTFLTGFKKSIVLLNLSRGKIMDTDHVIEALDNGKIKAFASDVLENEAFSTYSPNESKQINELRSNKNVLLTPHVAGWTVESFQKIAKLLAIKILIYLQNIEKN